MTRFETLTGIVLFASLIGAAFCGLFAGLFPVRADETEEE